MDFNAIDLESCLLSTKVELIRDVSESIIYDGRDCFVLWQQKAMTIRGKFTWQYVVSQILDVIYVV